MVCTMKRMNKHTFQRVTSQNSVKIDSKPLNLLLAEVNMVGANTHIWQKEYQTLNSQMKTRCTTTKALVYSSPLLFSKTSGTRMHYSSKVYSDTIQLYSNLNSASLVIHIHLLANESSLELD